MGMIADQFNYAFRDFQTDGVSASGLHEVDKSDVRLIGQMVEESFGLVGLGSLLSVAYGTRAALDADLAHSAGSVALVYADGTDANNDLYTKTGASGTGAWTLTNALHTILSGLAQPYTKRAANSVPFFTWAALAATTGMNAGDRATVLTFDAGTHTDPVVGGVVSNAGVYQYSAAPAGWQRLGDLDSQKAAVSAGLAVSAAPLSRSAAETLKRDVNYGDASLVSAGYLAIADGTFVANAQYETCNFIHCDDQDSFEITVDVVPPSGGTSSVFFYDQSQAFLGAYRMAAASEIVTIADHYTSARYIRVVDNGVVANGHAAGFIVRNVVALDPRRLAGVYRDFFATTDLTSVYVASADGSVISNDSFLTTPPIPAYSGQTFRVTLTGNALISTVSMWDRHGNWLGNAQTSSAADKLITCTAANLAFVRFTAQTGSTMTALGAQIAPPLDMPIGISPPLNIYMTVGEKWPLFARSCYPDTRFPLAWNKPLSNDRVFVYDAPASGVDTLKLATVLAGGFATTLATITVNKFNKPANPSGHVNILCLGDSTVQGTGAADGSGDYYDWPNELSWQITGTGRRAAADSGYFTSWGLTNVHFRGTRGAQTVKHEGRGGWSIRNYLDASAVGGVPNAFWNPAANGGAGGFDFRYWLTNNGFDDGSTLSGVNATGSNLIIFISLGWNDIDTRTQAQLISDFGELIDKIRTACSAVKIVLLGHTPSPVLTPIYRSNFGAVDRYLTARWIMIKYLQELDAVLASVVTAKTVSRLRWQVQFDAETGILNFTTLTLAPWQTDTYTVAADYVHPGAKGNMNWAHAIKGWLSQPGWIS